ncbi:MAG TPA: hypothetical protein VGE59_04035 [Patescibacteria group bacterium]
MPTIRSVGDYHDFYTRREAESSVRSLGSTLGQLVWFLVGFLESLLVLRFVFRLFGAADTSLTTWIYRLTEWLVTPFLRIVSTVQSGGLVLEIATLLTMFSVALIGILINALIESLRPTI